MVFILARPMDWIPMPVMICWSENERRSFRHIGAEVDLRRPRRMIMELSRMDMKFVIIKERRVPAPATPASVGVVSGTMEQFFGMASICKIGPGCCVV